VKDFGSLHERDRLVHQAMVQLFELQLHAGSTPDELIGLAQTCIAKAHGKKSLHLRASKMFDAQDYGTVLKSWHRRAEYLSKSGLPRGLTVNGKLGLRRLIERYYPKAQFSSVLRSLVESGLIVKGSNGRWHPTDKCAVFPRLNTELLAHLSEGVSLLVDTVTKNVTAKDRSDALFERSAKVRFLPASQADNFRTFVSRQGSAFLSAVDDWLESRARRGPKKQHASCTAGAFAFAFIDDEGKRPRKLRKRSRVRNRSASGHRAAHPSKPVSKSSRRLSSGGPS
jgi:hypothetical protein